MATWTFAPTPRMSTYITALCAGPFAAVRSEYRGIPMGVFCRRTLAQHLIRRLQAEAISASGARLAAICAPAVAAAAAPLAVLLAEQIGARFTIAPDPARPRERLEVSVTHRLKLVHRPHSLVAVPTCTVSCSIQTGQLVVNHAVASIKCSLRGTWPNLSLLSSSYPLLID